MKVIDIHLIDLLWARSAAEVLSNLDGSELA